MSLKEKLASEIVSAMKAKDETLLRTLRMLKAELMKEEVSGSSKKELTESDETKIIRRMVKQREEAAAGFRSGGNEASAVAEEDESKILEAYLPAQMDDAAIQAIVIAKKEALSVTDKAKMGMLIGAVMKEVGDRADGNRVKAIVEKALA